MPNYNHTAAAPTALAAAPEHTNDTPTARAGESLVQTGDVPAAVGPGVPEISNVPPTPIGE